MHVIGAGFGRTGTMSLKAALERLGAGPCLHMIDLLGNPELAAPWTARSRGEAIDWRAALAGWGSTVDWPGCTYWAELAEAWPDAPVLLTVRDPDAWYESTLKTIHAANDPEHHGSVDAGVKEMIGDIIWRDTFGGRERFLERDHAIRVFRAHNATVREAVSADRLLIYEIGEGWGPLCELLGVDVPDEPFPHLNDSAAFRAMIGLDSAPHGHAPADERRPTSGRS